MHSSMKFIELKMQLTIKLEENGLMSREKHVGRVSSILMENINR
jgi:hypothetical protein